VLRDLPNKQANRISGASTVGQTGRFIIDRAGRETFAGSDGFAECAADRLSA
jgi:hypothetical protein